MEQEAATISTALRTPRAAAVAGILFSLLLGLALILLRVSVPADQARAGAWLSDPGRRGAVALALNLVPFAGIAFLWFIGVVRDRIGQHEDSFFATMFLGSGLLFVAMLFVAAAVAGGLLADPSIRAGRTPPAEVWELGRITFVLLNVYALRMGAVFIVSTTTIGMRTKIIPRWLGVTGYVVALALLVSVGLTGWVGLLLPLWILALSIDILLAGIGAKSRAQGQLGDGQAEGPM